MKTKIKRHSRSVISVLLAVCMLVSCMTVGLIATDAAKVSDSEVVGGSDNNITDYYFKGSFDNWTKHYVNGSGNAYININSAGTYEFVVITGGGTQRRANHTFTSSGSYNAAQDNSNFKIKVTTPGTYTFKTSTMNSGGSVTVTLTFPSGGSTTSNDWRLVDGDCNWNAGSSSKKFKMNSTNGYYEYSQYFTGDNYFRIYDGSSQYNGNGGSSNVTLTAGGSFVNLGNATTSNSFYFHPSTAGTYIVQVDATNKKVRIQAATKYTVNCQPPSNGTLTSTLSSAYAGDTVTFTATPRSGYAFKSLVLTYDGVDHDVTSSVSGNTYTFTMPAFNVTAAATFTNSKTIYYNNYETQWSKVYVYTSKGSGSTLVEGNGPSPGQEMTRIGTTCIYSAEVPTDMTTIIFYGSGGASNKNATITCGTNINYGNAMPTGSYNEYKSTSANANTGTWSEHTGRTNYYTVTPGTSLTNNNNNLYYNGLNATLYDYYTDGEYNNGNANWITGIKKTVKYEYSVSDGSQYDWNPYKTLNEALSDYADSKSITYPLYFGNLNIRDKNNTGVNQPNLEYYRNPTTKKYTNFYYKINNSTNLVPGTASVTGLAANTEGKSSINHSSGAAMAMFDEDWLSRENATGKPLATILHSSAFPVRKVTATEKTTYPNKIYASLSSSYWGQGSPVIFAHFFDSNSNTSDVKMTYNSTSGYFEADIPTEQNYQKVIFVRCKPGTNSISWTHVDQGGNMWNKSNEYALPSGRTDRSRLYTNNGWDSFTKGNIATTYGTHDPGGYVYYEYDSTNGTDNAYIKNVNTSSKTATIEYSTTDKVWSSGVGGAGAQPGFYPFDNMTGGNLTNQNLGSSKTAHDLGYGMKLEIPFSLNANGTVDSTTTGFPQTFNFSGDDDLWVYIDGHLVLDLGGAHFRAEGSIDFKNKIATSTTKVIGASSAANNYTTDTTATATYSNNFGSWFDSNPNALHTMTLYYMERGMYDSNLKFDFSFHAIQNLYKTEKKVRTNSLNQGFYEVDSATEYNNKGITKFEQSYQDEVFNVDHKVSSTQTGSYGYPTESFSYAKVHNNVTSTQTYTYTTGGTNKLSYDLMNDDVAQFNGKFTTGDYFQLTETSAAGNKYKYTPTLTVYDDANKTKRNDVTSAGPNAFRFRFDEPDSTGMRAVNIRAQLENIMKQHDLKITKSIGDNTDPNTVFTFRITFNFDYEGSGSDNGYEGYPLFISSNKDSTKTQLYKSGSNHGYFNIKAGETITIPRIPEGADIKIEEIMTGITNYTYGGMSAIGAIATAVSGQDAVTMTMGENNIDVTALNNDNRVKATIRVKYAPTYYDFEHGTNISLEEYKKDGLIYNNIVQGILCVTEFEDIAKTTTQNYQYSMEETSERFTDPEVEGGDFEVKISEVNAGGKLFIGWYDENGNRYNDSDVYQHSLVAAAPKTQDRIFEARFIDAPTYRIDYDTPTRLWGNRIYKVFGKVDNSMISDGYIGYDSSRETTASVEKRYYLTGKLIEAKKPSETIFLKNITWPNIDDGKTSTKYNVSKLVTCNTDKTKNVEIVTQTGDVTYNLYRSVAASMTDRKVTIHFFNNCSDLDTLNDIWEGNYGDSVNNNETLAVNIPANKTFYRWRIETLNSLGGTALTADGVIVTYDYSKNFNYVAYDNYKVTAEIIPKRDGKDYNPYSAKDSNDPYHDLAPKNDTTVVNLGQTRSHWNDTENGMVYEPAEGESVNNTNANYNYDRMFIDLALSYSDGKETKLNTVDNLNVGFIIEYKKNGEWVKFKEANFSSKLLGDKNRIEYYYGFQNAVANRNAQLRVQPTIAGVASGTPLEFNFSADQFSAQTNY